ncbi:MAG TPA: OB-fold domain-containing protein [Thermoplasmata archaeon]|nr:OB-fold domain-containing protein [Thermoplasmata archaeon]
MSAAPHSIGDFLRGYRTERRLRGFRSGCGFVTATWGLLCPNCGRADLGEVELSGGGRVAAFTVQNVPSDEFLHDAPYAYVIVDLDEGGRITGWMPAVRSATELSVGDRVRWVPSSRSGVVFEKAGAENVDGTLGGQR